MRGSVRLIIQHSGKLQQRRERREELLPLREVARHSLSPQSQPTFEMFGALPTHFLSSISFSTQMQRLLRPRNIASCPLPMKPACTGFTSWFVRTGTLRTQRLAISNHPTTSKHKGAVKQEKKQSHLIKVHSTPPSSSGKHSIVARLSPLISA